MLDLGCNRYEAHRPVAGLTRARLTLSESVQAADFMDIVEMHRVIGGVARMLR